MRWTLELSLKKENLVAEAIDWIPRTPNENTPSYRIPAGFDFLSYSSKEDLEKVYWESMKEYL